MRTAIATAEVFFTAFKTLNRREKEVFFEKIFADPELREDLIDIALIEKAKKAKGKSVSARDYFMRRHKTEKAA